MTTEESTPGVLGSNEGLGRTNGESAPTKTYKLTTLRDIFDQVPADRVKVCLNELAQMIGQAHAVRELLSATMAVVTPNDGAVDLLWPEVCEWTDDDLGELTMHLGAGFGESELTLRTKRAAADSMADRHFPHEFEVWQDDEMQASTSGPRDTSLREAMHYAAQYGQDGPVRVFEVTRVLVSPREPTEVEHRALKRALMRSVKVVSP